MRFPLRHCPRPSTALAATSLLSISHISTVRGQCLGKVVATMDPRAPTAERGMGQGPVGWDGSQVPAPTETDACHCTPLGNALQSQDLG